MLNTQESDARYKKAFRAAAEKYGSPYAIPPEEQRHLAERNRAEHVVAIHGTATPEVLRSYSIPADIIQALCGDHAVAQPRKTRRQRWASVERWCAEHVGVTVTPAVLAEVGEFSEGTARKFINDRPDLFSRVKRGHFLVRDPVAERQQ